MAEAEHTANMQLYIIKKDDILTMKRRKVEESLPYDNEVGSPSAGYEISSASPFLMS